MKPSEVNSISTCFLFLRSSSPQIIIKKTTTTKNNPLWLSTHMGRPPEPQSGQRSTVWLPEPLHQRHKCINPSVCFLSSHPSNSNRKLLKLVPFYIFLPFLFTSCESSAHPWPAVSNWGPLKRLTCRYPAGPPLEKGVGNYIAFRLIRHSCQI